MDLEIALQTSPKADSSPRDRLQNKYLLPKLSNSQRFLLIR